MIIETVSLAAFGMGIGGVLIQRSLIEELKVKLKKTRDYGEQAIKQYEAETTAHQKTRDEFKAYREATSVQVKAKRSKKEQEAVATYVYEASAKYNDYSSAYNYLYRNPFKF